MLKVKTVQSEFETDRILRHYLSDMKSEYGVMESSDYGYIVNPTNEAMWQRKLDADEKVEKILQQINKLTTDQFILEHVNIAVELDEKVMNPFGQAAIKMLDTDRAGAIRLYELKIVPGYGFAQLELGRLVTYMENKEQETREQMLSISKMTVMILGGMIPLVAILGIFFIWRLRKAVVNPLENAVNMLLDQARVTSASSSEVTISSSELANATTEQAAALQETAASLEEMTAMIQKNADNAKNSTHAVELSTTAASRGQDAAKEVISSIHQIRESNSEIEKQIDESNRRMSEITNVISEIGDKTKVINDIVFQTKLLSFNASVEAARAGEHGRGFAVVAEEVGNLAQMSGVAAQEINGMLSISIKKVEEIVKDNKSSIERIIGGGQARILAGIKVAESTGETLQDIAEKVCEVNQMVSDITVATLEQAQGIEEINKAVGQLDQVTQTNTKVTQDISHSATQLGSQAASLENLASSLYQIVRGVPRE